MWLNDFSKFGWTGVDLFFVLSGFLISSQLFLQIKRTGTFSYKEFFLKRFFRIIPAFLTVIAIYFLFPAFHERESLPPLWKFLTFTQNFGLEIKPHGTFSHCWSLCVEEHFYLVLPLLTLVLLRLTIFKKGFWILIALFIGGFFLRYFIYVHYFTPYLNDERPWVYWYKFIYYPTYNRLDGLLTGVFIGGIYHFRPNIWNSLSKYGNEFLVIGWAVLTAGYFICYEEESLMATVYGFPIISIGYGLLAIGAICPTSIFYKYSSRITTGIATLSYSLYLTHKGIIHITQTFLATKNVDITGNLTMLICILTCLTGAYLLNKIVEKPFMKLRGKIVGR